MSDTPTPETLFQLRKPLELIDIVRNDMGEPADYLFRRTDGSEHEIISCGEDYVQRVFAPLDVSSIEKQLATKFEDAIDCGYLLGKAELAEVRTLDELVEVQKIRIRQLTDEVLVLFGLENKETEQ